MRIEATNLSGVSLLKPKVFHDHRVGSMGIFDK